MPGAGRFRAVFAKHPAEDADEDGAKDGKRATGFVSGRTRAKASPKPASAATGRIRKTMATGKSHYDHDDLIACGHGKLFGPGNAQLPLPPMLMFDRVTEVTLDGGQFGKGSIRAEFDVDPGLWFFQCHFEGDPVMPGCLGLDALWQLTGFYLGWLGEPGRGRALGVGEVKLTGQVTPKVKRLEYGVEFRRVMRSRLKLGIAEGWVKADGEVIYKASDLRVGLFKDEEAAVGG